MKILQTLEQLALRELNPIYNVIHRKGIKLMPKASQNINISNKIYKIVHFYNHFSNSNKIHSKSKLCIVTLFS